ncbi:MAG: DUF1566 domain-containing protein [Methylovulum sp.]|nr:MAG: DUF1566 domain-containing protein [Methylovulum sp.]
MKRLKLCLYFCLLIHAQLGNAQRCNPDMIADAPDSRYTMNVNGTVLDKKTTLTWMRCSLGQTWDNGACTGSAQEYQWRLALVAAKKTVFAGKKDWRLPNIKELQSLVEYRCYGPAINLTAFPNAIRRGGWSSSPVAHGNDFAWAVYFGYGYAYWDFKFRSYYVRLVRSGQ